MNPITLYFASNFMGAGSKSLPIGLAAEV